VEKKKGKFSPDDAREVNICRPGRRTACRANKKGARTPTDAVELGSSKQIIKEKAVQGTVTRC